MLVFYAFCIAAAFLKLIIYFVGRRPKDDLRIANPSIKSFGLQTRNSLVKYTCIDIKIKDIFFLWDRAIFGFF